MFGKSKNLPAGMEQPSTEEAMVDDSASWPSESQLDRRQHSRRMTVYQQRTGRPRWVLHTQAVFWRALMRLGMFFHRLAPPRPPKPNFSRTIRSKISSTPGPIRLHFYVPKDYDAQRRLDSDGGGSGGDGAEGNGGGRSGGYPVIINFHGGGFTLGSALDDARWCGTVVDECNAVVVSVDYRLAPEHPFPTAVDDGADAVAYIHEHADEFGIDREKIALSGFSSGGNMCFTVPLRLHDEAAGFPRDEHHSSAGMSSGSSSSSTKAVASNLHSPPSLTGSREGLLSHEDDISATSSSTAVAPAGSSQTHFVGLKSRKSSGGGGNKKTTTVETISESASALSQIKIRCIIPWYPSVDYTRTREQRRATCVRKDQELPALFTDLFDESYLHPPATISLDSPYLSPGVAPTSLLRDALPYEIIMHTCEWDMLLDEAQAFRQRLERDDIGRKVVYSMVPGVPHGWDKAPNPWKPTPGVREHYLRACREIRRVMGPTTGARPLIERLSTAGPSAAPRGSVSVVR